MSKSEPLTPETQHDKYSKTAWFHKVLLNRGLQGCVALLVVSILVPCFMYMIFMSREIDVNLGAITSTRTCTQASGFHVQCGRDNMAANVCNLRGCCFTGTWGCFHSWPSEHQYYVAQSGDGIYQLKPTKQITPYGTSASALSFRVVPKTENRVEFLFSSDRNTVVAIEAPILEEGLQLNYQNTLNQNPFTIEVDRPATKQVLMSSKFGPLTSSINHFEWSLHLGADVLSGLGDFEITERPFKKLLLATNETNAFPIIYAYNSTEKTYHGIKLNSKGPIEVEITASHLIIFRIMSSLLFSVELAIGPTMNDVFSQLMSNTRTTEFSIPESAFGIHVCRNYEYDNLTESARQLNELISNAELHGIPFDSHCIQDNYNWMESSSTAIWDLVELLKNSNKSVIASLRPQLSITDSNVLAEANTQNILLLNTTGTGPYVGIVNKKLVAYYDWTKTDQIANFFANKLDELLTRIDGLTIIGHCLEDESTIKDQPFVTDFPFISSYFLNASESLIPFNIQVSGASMIFNYNAMVESCVATFKSIINSTQILATNSWSLNENSIGIKRSVANTWAAMRDELSNNLISSIAGTAMPGFVVCGSGKEVPDAELCLRWYQVASVMPFFRINDDRMPHKYSTTTMRLMVESLRRRYSLLSYFNTIYRTGELFLRPISYDFPQFTVAGGDGGQWEQFHIGKAILVAPVLLPMATRKLIHFPDKYYELWGGHWFNVSTIEMSVVLADLPMFIRSGSVVALHRNVENTLTTKEVFQSSMQLIVALNCSESLASCKAEGSLAFAPQLVWKFNANSTHLSISMESGLYFNTVLCLENAEMSSEIDRMVVYRNFNNLTELFTVEMNFMYCLETLEYYEFEIIT